MSENIVSRYRTHLCGELREEHISQTIKLSGWVHRKRDHGELLFIDLRDHSGLCQCVIETSSKHFQQAENLSLESVVTIEGLAIKRSAETYNELLPTGMLELQISSIETLGPADTLPMPVNSDAPYPEDIRMEYRFLDLRREHMQRKIRLRDEVIATIRLNMRQQGFVEIQTPILSTTSPEGARDFLVPSRLHPGKFYALPQAPQIFKQLLMTAGFDRYFQISPCFRDEDARADRSPGEFYQLDFEMAFVTQEEVLKTAESVIYEVFDKFSDRQKIKHVSKPPFLRLSYDDALSRYGSDKPDLRNPLELQEVGQHFADSSLKIFAKIVAEGGFVKAIKVPLAGKRGRAWFDKLNSWAREKGEPGIGYIAWSAGEARGPIAKNLEAEKLKALASDLEVGAEDAVFFIASTYSDDKPGAHDLAFAASARDHLARQCDLVDESRFELLWVVDYPLFERNPQNGGIKFSHNPFSMPQGGMKALEEQPPLEIKAWQYDIVCNGVEISSGAIRNHEAQTLIKAFEIAGHKKADVEKSFSGMLKAFRLGAPPHGGSAPGIERILMLLTDSQNIREVTAFPLSQTAQDLMLGAPNSIDPETLKELGIKTIEE